MIDLLTLAAEQTEGMMRPAVLTFLRVGAAIATVPAFGEQSIPARFRIGAALAFTAVILPAVADRYDGQGMLLPALAETLSGLILGLSLRLMIIALQMTATLAAQSASLSQLFASAGAEPMPALGTLLSLAAIALGLQAGLHVKVALLFVTSYDLLPAERMPNARDVASWGVSRIGMAMSLSFSLAAPFVAGALLWNVALGLMNRAMPHLMLAFIGAPALAWGGLIMTALCVPIILAVWLAAFDSVILAPLGTG